MLNLDIKSIDYIKFQVAYSYLRESLTERSIESNYFVDTFEKQIHSVIHTNTWQLEVHIENLYGNRLSNLQRLCLIFFVNMHIQPTSFLMTSTPSSGLFVWSWHLKIEPFKIIFDSEDVSLHACSGFVW